jgi:aspartyl-tRNA(Asn)/glutamyl-tRNA(Gln) amidotransferase subunit A
MSGMEELHKLSLRQVASFIERKEVSPVEVLDVALQRIERIDPKISAFVTLTSEQARLAAEAAEKAIAAGYYLGVLHGIPIGLKDNIYSKGVLTAAGSKILAEFIPDEDATVTARLRALGAIIVGKLNMHEFAWGATTDNPFFGTTRNPWDTERFPGGSSGGSGAAVAGRLCYGALGTDTGGSIRVPAAINGVVGLAPTIGRVSNYNVVAHAWTEDVVGPLTRTVEDCAIMLGTIAGFDPRDPGTAQEAVPDFTADLNRGLGGVRLAIIDRYHLIHDQEEVHLAVEAALEALSREGASIHRTDVPHLDHHMSAQFTIETCESTAYHQQWLRERAQDYGSDVLPLLQLGEFYLATHYIQAQRYRTLLRSELMEVFRTADAIVSPTLPFTATPIGATEVEIEPGQPEDMLSIIMQYTALPSLAGLPALSIACGFSSAGLPIGLQIIGRPFDELTLFRIGHAYQRVTDWHTREPNL